MKRSLVLAIVVALLAATANANIITAVDRTNGTSGDRAHIGAFDGNTDPSVEQPDPLPDSTSLVDGHYCFSDRTYPWTGTPAELQGAEYIQTFNTDKGGDGSATANYAVTIGQAATMFITVDDRWFPDDGIALQTKADETVAAFAAPGTFTDTGLDLFIHENDTTDRQMSVFSAALGPGTYNFGPLPSNKNHYTIGAIPEPSTLIMLIGVTLAGLLAWRRRR